MKRWQALISVSLTALTVSACSQSDPPWYVYLEEARHACSLGDEKATEQALKEAKADAEKAGGCPTPLTDPPAQPREPRTYTGELCSLADCLAFHNQLDQAEAIDKEALSIAEKYPDKCNISSPLRALANVYEKEKKYAEAEKTLKTLTEKSAGNFDNVFLLARCLLLEGKTEAALELSKKTIEEEKRLPIKAPNLAEHLNVLGYCYYNLHQLDAAEKTYKEALNYNPGGSDPERGDQFHGKDLKPLGDVYLAKDDYEKAETFYRSALSGHFERPLSERIELLQRDSQVLQKLNKESLWLARENEIKARQRELETTPPTYQPTVYD